MLNFWPYFSLLCERFPVFFPTAPSLLFKKILGDCACKDVPIEDYCKHFVHQLVLAQKAIHTQAQQANQCKTSVPGKQRCDGRLFSFLLPTTIINFLKYLLFCLYFFRMTVTGNIHPLIKEQLEADNDDLMYTNSTPSFHHSWLFFYFARY